jgi:Ni,Fe-hydrogenase III small subunit
VSFAVQALTRSLNVFHLAGSACNNCDIEILDALTPKYDVERFGITLVGSIRHADVLLLSGIFNKKSAVRARRLYEHAPKPVLVIAVGGCPATGIIFRDSYNWDGPPGQYLPIDAYVPGCPPRPEAIISGVLALVRKLRAASAGKERKV